MEGSGTGSRRLGRPSAQSLSLHRPTGPASLLLPREPVAPADPGAPPFPGGAWPLVASGSVTDSPWWWRLLIATAPPWTGTTWLSPGLQSPSSHQPHLPPSSQSRTLFDRSRPPPRDTGTALPPVLSSQGGARQWPGRSEDSYAGTCEFEDIKLLPAGLLRAFILLTWL